MQDSARWPRLFAIAGAPLPLFESCLSVVNGSADVKSTAPSLRQLQTASRYLLVIYRLVSANHAKTAAERLLKMIRARMAARSSRSSRLIELEAEIVRFVHLSVESERESSRA